MKKIIIVLVFLPLFSLAQSLDSLLFVDFGVGVATDLNYSKEDVSTYSPDMSSCFSEDGILKKGIELNLGMKLNEKWKAGLGFLNSSIYGFNDVEYYEGKFIEKNFFVEYDFKKYRLIDLFLSASTGLVDYEAKRFLTSDNSELTINSPEGRAFKVAIAFGLKMKFSNDIQLIFKHNISRINDDGFDGWDYGTNVDLYSFSSINLRLPFSILSSGNKEE